VTSSIEYIKAGRLRALAVTTATRSEALGTVMVGSPADFGKFIADETDKLGKVVKFAGIKPD
jgi:hypothetical protein